MAVGVLFWVLLKGTGLLPVGKGVSNVIHKQKEVVIPSVVEQVQTQPMADSNYGIQSETTEIWTDGVNQDDVVEQVKGTKVQTHGQHVEHVEL